MFLLPVVVIVCMYLIIKRYQIHSVLLGGGMILLLYHGITTGESPLPQSTRSGILLLDIFDFIRMLAVNRIVSIGFIIMCAGGYVAYMRHINASDALASIAAAPLSKIASPYVVLMFVSILGQLMSIFIPSASGLALLMLVSVCPVIVKMGVSPLSAVAVAATSSAVDFGPASGMVVAAADMLGTNSTDFFLKYQLPSLFIAVPLTGIAHMFTQKYFDKDFVYDKSEISCKQPKHKAPMFYAILPVLPIVILLILYLDGIYANVATVFLISAAFTLLCRIIETRKVKDTLNDLQVFMKGMSSQLADAVLIIACAELFTAGIIETGGIKVLTNISSGNVAIYIILAASFILTSVTGTVGGYYAIIQLAPVITEKIGVSMAALIIPMQLTSAVSRALSLVAPVMVVCAANTGYDVKAILKRTSIPMTVSLIASLAIINIFNFI